MHVVADRFATFADNDAVMALGAVRQAVRTGVLPFPVPAVLAPGQGIDADQWAQLGEEIARSGLPEPPSLAPGPAALTAPAQVLKLRQPNVLLSDLRECGPLSYAADLVVTDGTEMILDHTADRQHIPGLLLMEACCQMIIAVTRRFFAAHGHEHYAVMQHFDIDFQRFVFPLPAELVLSINTHGDGTDSCDRMPFAVTIDILQGGQACARAHWNYRAFRPATVFTAEAGQAVKALAAAEARVPSPASQRAKP